MQIHPFVCIVGLSIAMSFPRELNGRSLDLIKNSKGWRKCAYKDPVGKETIGYEHLVKSGDGFNSKSCISKAIGTQLLKSDVSEASKCIDRIVKVPLNDDEHGALTSWTYNIGCGNAKSSTLVKKLNNGNKHLVCEQLNRWTKAGGKTLPGLEKRRENECNLFLPK